jgi:hypothetical protein
MPFSSRNLHLMLILGLGCFASCREEPHLISLQGPGQFPKPGLPERYTGRWTIKLDGTDTVLRECTFIDGKLYGMQRFWNKNGQLKHEGAFLNGREDGRHRHWDEMGNLSGEYWWRDGKHNGPIREWDHGVATRKGNYKEDRKHGRWIVWDWSGNLLADGMYKMDAPLNGTFIIQEGKGMHVDRYRDGKLIDTGEWR